MLRGVVSVSPGYTGGSVAHPTYEQVSSGATGHAEAIRFEYDPARISYEDLLNVFFATHDPTTKNRQGNDVGPQYRSAIFYATEEQKKAAEACIASLNSSEKTGAPIVTTVEPLTEFWPAEDYHRQYYEHHKDQPYCQIIINPKLEKMQNTFASLLKTSEREAGNVSAKYIGIIAVSILVVLGAFFLYRAEHTGNGVVPTATPFADSKVQIDSPLPNALVRSPLTVRGRARGTWYFEASFPVVLVDGSGKVIAQAPAHALSDWMTTDWVPFEVTLTFTQPSSINGALILQKDNPSGDPQRDESRQIPVLFR